MITVPAAVWRGGTVAGGLVTGTCLGLFFGGVAWLDSGMWLSGAAVLIVLGIGSGVWMARRMNRSWPGASELTGAQRFTVVDAVRRGEPVADSALRDAARDYRRGLREVAERDRTVRWLVLAVLLAAVAMAVWDALLGSWSNTVASVVYLALIGLELGWWPGRRQRLLANADRAVGDR